MECAGPASQWECGGKAGGLSVGEVGNNILCYALGGIEILTGRSYTNYYLHLQHLQGATVKVEEKLGKVEKLQVAKKTIVWLTKHIREEKMQQSEKLSCASWTTLI